MNSDELKDKIVAIVRVAMLEADELPFIEATDAIADALIAAGIGDVAEEKNLRESAESFYMKKCKECSSISKELRQSKHHAAMAERAFSKLVHEMYEHGIRPMCDEKFFVESRLKDAEKELAEEGKND